MRYVAEPLALAILITAGIFSPFWYLTFIGVPFAALMMPIVIAFVSIVTASQKNGHLDVTGNQSVTALLRIWLYLVIATGVIWMMLYSRWAT